MPFAQEPILVLGLTLPIGLLGAACALMVHGEPLSFMAILGIVAMAGVVINNAIVLMSFINNNRAAGMSIEEACVEAGYTRLRPIWASAITTLAGLVPPAYGWGGFEPFVQPMARTMAWGLAFAMPITLFLIPIGTLFVEDVNRGLAHLFRWSGAKGNHHKMVRLRVDSNLPQAGTPSRAVWTKIPSRPAQSREDCPGRHDGRRGELQPVPG